MQYIATLLSKVDAVTSTRLLAANYASTKPLAEAQDPIPTPVQAAYGMASL